MEPRKSTRARKQNKKYTDDSFDFTDTHAQVVPDLADDPNPNTIRSSKRPISTIPIEQLSRACELGQLTELENQLIHTPNIQFNDDDLTLFYMALERGHLPVAKRLLIYLYETIRQRIFAENYRLGETIDIAAVQQHAENEARIAVQTEILRAYGIANACMKKPGNQKICAEWVWRQLPNITRQFLQDATFPQIPLPLSCAAFTEDGSTVIHVMARFKQCGEAELLRLKEESGHDFQTKNNWGATPAFFAAQGNNIRSFEILTREKKASSRKNRLVAELYFARTRQADVLTRFENWGVNQYIQTIDGDNILHIACGAGNKEVIIDLIQNNFFKYARNHRGQTPGDVAAEAGHHDLAASYFNIVKDAAPTTDLEKAILANDIEQIKERLENGEYMDRYVLQFAFEYATDEVLAIFIERGLSREDRNYLVVNAARRNNSYVMSRLINCNFVQAFLEDKEMVDEVFNSRSNIVARLILAQMDFCIGRPNEAVRKLLALVATHPSILYLAHHCVQAPETKSMFPQDFACHIAGQLDEGMKRDLNTTVITRDDPDTFNSLNIHNLTDYPFEKLIVEHRAVNIFVNFVMRVCRREINSLSEFGALTKLFNEIGSCPNLMTRRLFIHTLVNMIERAPEHRNTLLSSIGFACADLHARDYAFSLLSVMREDAPGFFTTENTLFLLEHFTRETQPEAFVHTFCISNIYHQWVAQYPVNSEVACVFAPRAVTIHDLPIFCVMLAFGGVSADNLPRFFFTHNDAMAIFVDQCRSTDPKDPLYSTDPLERLINLLAIVARLPEQVKDKNPDFYFAYYDYIKEKCEGILAMFEKNISQKNNLQACAVMPALARRPGSLLRHPLWQSADLVHYAFAEASNDVDRIASGYLRACKMGSTDTAQFGSTVMSCKAEASLAFSYLQQARTNLQTTLDRQKQVNTLVKDNGFSARRQQLLLTDFTEAQHELAQAEAAKDALPEEASHEEMVEIAIAIMRARHRVTLISEPYKQCTELLAEQAELAKTIAAIKATLAECETKMQATHEALTVAMAESTMLRDSAWRVVTTQLPIPHVLHVATADEQDERMDLSSAMRM